MHIITLRILATYFEYRCQRKKNFRLGVGRPADAAALVDHWKQTPPLGTLGVIF